MKLRLTIVLMLLLAGGAIAVDRVSPAEPLHRSTLSLAPDAGVLTCPYLTEPKASASVQLANVGTGTASVRIGIGAAKGPPISVSVSVPAGSTKSMQIPAAADRTGAVIEFSGGSVVATHTMILQKLTGPVLRSGGAAASPCARAGGQDVVITGASTLGSDAELAVFNPGSADADVSVSLIADGRVIQPQRLSRRVIPSHARLDFRLGDFAFNARALTAIVHANAGRVVAEALIRSATGVELLPGQVPANDLVAITGQSGTGSVVGVSVIGGDDAGLEARLINARNQVSVGGFPPSLPPYTGRSLSIPDQGGAAPAAYSFGVDVGSPIVAETTWTTARAGAQELASLPGAVPSSRWAAVVGAFQAATATRAVIVDPRGVASDVRITTIGPTGTSSQELTIPAGRLVDIGIGNGAGTFAVIVDADGPVVLAVRSFALVAGKQGTSFAVVGESFTAAAPEAVAIDPRAGIPGVFPTP